MSQRKEFLSEMGIETIWKHRGIQTGVPAPVAVSEINADTNTSEDDYPHSFLPEEYLSEPRDKRNISSMNWSDLERTVLECTACDLCHSRTQAVPGVGDKTASWLFIGEGPGFFEDQKGEPFVGASGKLLDNMLLSLGLNRTKDVYIANVVKCRPTDDNGKDRPPTMSEANACHAFLARQITLIKPKIIVTLGRVASTTLLNLDPQTSLASLRRRVHKYKSQDLDEIPLIATYHPAYLLRQLPDKKRAWEDLCLAVKTLEGN